VGNGYETKRSLFAGNKHRWHISRDKQARLNELYNRLESEAIQSISGRLMGDSGKSTPKHFPRSLIKTHVLTGGR